MPALFRFEFLALLAQDRFAAELDLIAFESQHLYQNLIALFQLIAHLLNAVFRNLADMQKAVRAGENFDECAEVDQPDHLAEIRLADFGHGRDVGHALDGLFSRFAIRRIDIYRAVIVDIDLDAGLVDNAADHLAARTDQLANLVGRYRQSVYARRILLHLRS